MAKDGGPAAWEYALAHHYPERYDRTLCLAVGRRTVRLCARCTGQGLGLLALVVGATVGVPAGFALFAPSYQLLIALAPLPAAVDWLTQAVGRRESTTGARLITGALLGFAFADLAVLLLVRPWWWFVIGVGVFGLYVVAILAVLLATGAWRSVLREHFPGVVGPSGPPPGSQRTR